MSGAFGSPPVNQGYAGELDSPQAWKRLGEDALAQLIDVRTDAEWRYVGVPDLSSIARQPLLIEWQRYPGLGQNPDFVDEVTAALERAGYREGAALYFLCRSGSRSRAAAMVMTAAGYGPCFNVRDGFEGGLDDDRHRGSASGWKVAGLPWVQS